MRLGHIPHQALVTGRSSRRITAALSTLQRRQRCPEPPQLDAITTGSSPAHQHDQIPGAAHRHANAPNPSAIHLSRPNPTERTRHKPRGRQPWLLQITHPTPRPATYNSPQPHQPGPAATTIKEPPTPPPGHRNTTGATPDPGNQRRTYRRINRRLSRTIGILTINQPGAHRSTNSEGHTTGGPPARPTQLV